MATKEVNLPRTLPGASGREEGCQEDGDDDNASGQPDNVDASVSDYSVNSQHPLVKTLQEEEIDLLLRKAGIRCRPYDGGGGVDDDAGSIDSRGECRVGQCRLLCLQPFATIASFTAMCCMLATLTGALTAGYVNSVITTIEKRFEIGSSYSGLIAASVEIGGVLSVIFVSYFGGTRHIPNWIGFGALFTGFGTLIFTVPHMLAPAYTVTGGLNSSRRVESICRSPRSFDDDDVDGDDPAGDVCLAKESGQVSYVLIFVVAQMLIGMGGSPLYTLGTTYIDNHVAKCQAPSYIGKCSSVSGCVYSLLKCAS